MMFRINRLKIIVKTERGSFGHDSTFDKRINFIASLDNTKGKSSCIEAIYYSLGLEELIGSKNERALRPVFRKNLEYNGKEIKVYESEFYLEIQKSSQDIVTIYRTANKENHKSNLVTVYYGDTDAAVQNKVISEDMYVHLSGAATNQKGFHRFLEAFIGWELPDVPTYDDIDRKLYLQTLFAAMFVEQKRGWADILATIPTNFRIKDVRQRVVEFLIGLETLKNERLKQKSRAEENRIKTEWNNLIREIYYLLNSKNCYLQGIPAQPEVLDDRYEQKVSIFRKIAQAEPVLLETNIKDLKAKLNSLKENKIIVGDNINEFQTELLDNRQKVQEIEELLSNEREKLIYEKSSVEILIRSLELINKDLQNNKDAYRIKQLGSTQDWRLNKDLCPTCHQKIHDSLLPQDIEYDVMSIEENIKHLEAQKGMIEFGLKGHRKNISTITDNIIQLEAKLFTINRIIRSLVNDIYTVDTDIAETTVQKRLLTANEIEDLESLQGTIMNKLAGFTSLTKQWEKLLLLKLNLPKERFTTNDLKCLGVLENHLRYNLKEYGYKSINLNDVEISKDKLLPTVQGFDMKFDSSASDNIRAIWAFTIALMQTSNQCHGNHPHLLVFDEPDQQSIVAKDMENFLKSIVEFKTSSQVIIGITLKDEDIRGVLKRLEKDSYKVILIEDKAIAPINQNYSLVIVPPEGNN